MTARQRWDQLGARFLGLQPRERILVVATVVGLILFGGWQLAVAPALAEAEQGRQLMRQITAETGELESRLALVEAALARDPNEPLRQRKERLQQNLDETRQKLDSLASNLISPEVMVGLLRQMLSHHGGLVLESVEYEPATAVGGLAEDVDAPSLYRHTMTVTVSGRYFELVEYLRELENLDDRLGWRGLRYDVQEWPNGRLQIHLVTFSLSEEWLGV